MHDTVGPMNGTYPDDPTSTAGNGPADGMREPTGDWASVRRERNRRLAESDWTQMADTPLRGAGKVAWATYRAALRDLPQTQFDAKTVAWPHPPR